MRARLGGGGLGEVFVARDLRSDREVAVKVLDAAPVPVERLTRLAGLLRAAMGAEHPVVMLPRIQVGAAESPPFLAGDLVAGEDLAGLLRRAGPLPWQRALAIVHAAAEGLWALAEATGATHRALKPGNVRVTPEDEVRVLDFGIAELGVQPVPPREDGSVAEYRAPEQLAGLPGDASSDVFTLGVLLFELTTGVHPFAGPTAFKAARSVLTRRAAPRPAELAAGTPLPSQVEALIVRALAPGPSQRFGDVAELARHLALIRRSPGMTPRTRGAPAARATVDEDPTQRHEAPVNLDDRTTIVSLPGEGPREAAMPAAAGNVGAAENGSAVEATANERAARATANACAAEATANECAGGSGEHESTGRAVARGITGGAAENGSTVKATANARAAGAGNGGTVGAAENASTVEAEAHASTAGFASPSKGSALGSAPAVHERTLVLASNGSPVGSGGPISAPVDATVADRTVADRVERTDVLRGSREETLVLPAFPLGRAPSSEDDRTMIVLPETGSIAPAEIGGAGRPASVGPAHADLVDRTVRTHGLAVPVGDVTPAGGAGRPASVGPAHADLVDRTVRGGGLAAPTSGPGLPASAGLARADLADRTALARGPRAPVGDSMPARWRRSPLFWPGLLCALAVALALFALWTFART
nr:serine/threonine-protein kinase [Nannocystis pusilla]